MFEEYVILSIDNIIGQDKVTVDGDVVKLPFEKKYQQGTKITLKANPDKGWYFEGWDDMAEEDANITITMNDGVYIDEVRFEEEGGGDGRFIPGFMSTLLLLGDVIAVVIYKKRNGEV